MLAFSHMASRTRSAPVCYPSSLRDAPVTSVARPQSGRWPPSAPLAGLGGGSAGVPDIGPQGCVNSRRGVQVTVQFQQPCTKHGAPAFPEIERTAGGHVTRRRRARASRPRPGFLAGTFLYDASLRGQLIINNFGLLISEHPVRIIVGLCILAVAPLVTTLGGSTFTFRGDVAVSVPSCDSLVEGSRRG